MGAVDYITKPISPPIVLARVADPPADQSGRRFPARTRTSFLEDGGRPAHARGDGHPGRHHSRHGLAGRDPRHRHRQPHPPHPVLRQGAGREAAATIRASGSSSTRPTIDLLFKSAPLHDIGKVGIPDRILLKPGRFDADEFEIMKTHTTLGRDAIQHAEDRLGMEVDFLAFRQGDRLLSTRRSGTAAAIRRAGGRRHPDLGPPDGGRRRLRRVWSAAGSTRRGCRTNRRFEIILEGQRHALRSRCRGCLRGDRRRDLRHRRPLPRQ